MVTNPFAAAEDINLTEELPFDVVGADPDIREKLISMAEKQDDSAYERWIDIVDHKELRKAADEAVPIVAQRLYKLCQSILEEPVKVPEGEDSPGNAQLIMDRLINQPAKPETQQMREQALAIIKTLRWLRWRALGLALPKTIQKLAKIATNHFSADDTYTSVIADRAIAENLIIGLHEIVFPEGSFVKLDPNTRKPVYDNTIGNALPVYVDDVVTLLNMPPDEGELWGMYILRTSNALYFLQLACDLLLTAQTASGAKDDDKIDFHTAFELAPAILLPMAGARDDLLLTLTQKTAKALSPTTPNTPAQPASTPLVPTASTVATAPELDIA